MGKKNQLCVEKQNVPQNPPMQWIPAYMRFNSHTFFSKIHLDNLWNICPLENFFIVHI